MPTKSINISATGPSWETGEWKNTVLRDLRSGEPCVFPACAFGVQPMAALVEVGLFRRDFPPGDGDLIGLEIDGEMAEFGVFRVRGEFHCDETRDANPRKLRYSEAELTMHSLIRERFYAVMATDLGVSAQVGELSRGIWELGKKALPKQGRSKVIFIEDGVRESDLTLFLMRDGYNSHCLLFHGELPRRIEIPGKIIVQSMLDVRDGRFVSEFLEDLVASQKPSAAETGIDLEVSPPILAICGQEFKLPDDRGRPTLGVLYLAHLFENPRSLISCWDIERMVNPKLRELASIASGADPRMDKDAQRALDESIKQANTSLEEAKRDPGAAQFEIDEAQSELDRLLEQKLTDTGKGGKSRLLGDTDKEKSRRRVRKALDAVVTFVANQDPAIGEPLREAVGEGAEIYFNPPPDWGV